VQRFNAVLLHDSLPATDCTDFVFTLQFFNLPRDYIYRGFKKIMIIIIIII